jgi:hypothetical protein
MMILILWALLGHFLVQLMSMVIQKRCSMFIINNTIWIATYLASSQTMAWWIQVLCLTQKTDRQDIMLDTDESFAFQEDEVIMGTSTNVYDVDNEDDLLQFTDRLRGQHTSEEMMSLKLLK